MTEHAPTRTAGPLPLEQALEETRAAAREQLSAAWQLQLERIEEELQAGWREQVGRVFEERFAELAARLIEEFDRSVAERAAELASERVRAERRAAFEELNCSVRRLCQARGQGEWAAALLDAVAGHCHRALLFSVALRSVVAEGSRGFDEAAGEGWAGREIRLQAAPALAAAIESRDVVVTLRSGAEISPELAALTGESESERAHLYPVLARGRSAALLYAEPHASEGAQSALDLLVAAGGLSLGALAPSSALVALEPAGAAPPALPQQEQELHLRAQRFARVQAAEMRLYHSAEVRRGRAERNLYQALRGPIDTAREAFGRQFMTGCPSMTDYLHQEMVRTLANSDAAAMGASYPGPLV